MTIRERTRYPLPPSEIWPYIVQPELFILWNPKIKELHTSGEFLQGQEFWTEYSFKSKSSTCSTIITEADPLRCLRLEHRRFQQDSGEARMHVRESFLLVPKGPWTELRHVVNVTGHGMNIFIVMLFWFITTFGTTVESDKLEKLLSSHVKRSLSRMSK